MWQRLAAPSVDEQSQKCHFSGAQRDTSLSHRPTDLVSDNAFLHNGLRSQHYAFAPHPHGAERRPTRSSTGPPRLRGPLRISTPTEAKGGWVKGGHRPVRYMPSRQERRKAERDAAKRAPGQAGTPRATGAKALYAAALADINVRINAGDWSTQIADPEAFLSLGADKLTHRRAWRFWRMRQGKGTRTL